MNHRLSLRLPTCSTVLLLFAVFVSRPVFADEVTTEGPEGEDATEQDSVQPTDPLTEKLSSIVDGYYVAIAFEPTADDRKRGIEAVQMLLLSGIGLTQIEKATQIAVRMHSPGRRIPFEVAVPLRIGMTESPPPQASAPVPNAGITASGGSAGAVTVLPQEPALSPEEQRLRDQRLEAERSRRTRYGLYRHWRERTILPRTLLGVGIPLLAGSYALGFATVGVARLAGEDISASLAWAVAVPVIGPAIIAGVHGNGSEGLVLFTLLQAGGLALVIPGAILHRRDLPYDKDPSALHLGKRRDGRAALSLRLSPAPNGALLFGQF